MRNQEALYNEIQNIKSIVNVNAAMQNAQLLANIVEDAQRSAAILRSAEDMAPQEAGGELHSPLCFASSRGTLVQHVTYSMLRSRLIARVASYSCIVLGSGALRRSGLHNHDLKHQATEEDVRRQNKE